MAAAEKTMRILSREHFFNLLDSGHEEFRITTVTPGKNKREISEDAPFDRDDPMSYVLVNLIFDEIQIAAKGDFANHDLAEAQRIYGGANPPRTMAQQLEDLRNEVSELRALLTKKHAA